MTTAADQSPGVTAAAKVFPCRFLKLSSTAMQVEHAGANQQIFGITDEDTRSAIDADAAYLAIVDEAVNVHTKDGTFAYVDSGGAANIAIGNRLKADANGKAEPALTTGTVVQEVGAIAMQASTAADTRILVMISKQSLLPAAS